jgi:flagellar biosynthetic protein FlhB
LADEAGDKTEEPTPKKIEDARKEGNVPKSQDTSTFISLVISLVALWFAFGFIVDKIKDLYVYYMSFYGQPLSVDTVISISIFTIMQMSLMLMPLLLPVVIAGVLANVSQFGFNFTTKPLTPKFSKLNPIKGFKNVISIKKLVDGTKMTFKAFITLGIAFYFFFQFAGELQEVVLFGYFDQLQWLKDKAIILVSIILAIFFIFAVIDFIWTRYNYKKENKMTKQQVKEEHKQMEGSPEVKQRMAQIRRDLARKTMLSDVKSADVIVTNPTHYSVALRYDTTKEVAPKVVGKGVNILAFKIREIAKAEGIPLIAKPELARELYKVVEIDQEIPQNLFTAVVEVFTLITKANRGR